MAKTEFLQIRLSPEDRERLKLAAEKDHLDVSTWARQVILKEIDRRESRKRSRKSKTATSD